MANYANLLATIAANIYTNNNNEVTASMVKAAVDQMVASLGAGYQFMGFAGPTTNPGTPDARVFYIATAPGTYTHFNGEVVGENTITILRYDSGWTRTPLSYSMMKGDLASGDLNDMVQSGTYLLASSETYTNAPVNFSAGFLRISRASGTWLMQELYDLSGTNLWKRRARYSGGVYTWSAWAQIGGSGGGTTINNNFNEYTQTLSVSATPSITTDTNNYLATTGDSTDRTADILALLGTTGACHLGPGDFYVKDLIMPDYTAIFGSGPATRIIMDAGDGFAIKLGSRCMVKDFQLTGTTTTYTPSGGIGNRDGIIWQGTFTDDGAAPRLSLVSNLIISKFDGGGITCYDTGTGTSSMIAVENVLFDRCDVGINISYYSEYHNFTNCRTSNCWVGCINNGGNNTFVNCNFSSCDGTAFIMDNEHNQSPNNSHGSCVGCTFNHTAGNTGIGIDVRNCRNGYVFTGCQIFYSQISLDDAEGIVFSACNFGNSNCDIVITGGGAILFANNMHQAKPTITISGNTDTHFVNCYNRTTGELIIP